MTTRIAAMLKNDRGDLLPYTCQSAASKCEEWCQENLGNFEKVKELGGKVVQVEIRELPDAGASAEALLPVEAAQRVARYLHERALVRQLDSEEITSMHSGTDREANLLTADLAQMSAYILAQSR